MNMEICIEQHFYQFLSCTLFRHCSSGSSADIFTGNLNPPLILCLGYKSILKYADYTYNNDHPFYSINQIGWYILDINQSY